ncbi:flagellar biosynthesis protein FliQ [Terrarubrum flagellatum]|uniref:flagellar biosynthesis protein FliQ n=1 Tax=Terrirubrum flagellatum TaxID=2895980 RepID=UPI0031452E38
MNSGEVIDVTRDAIVTFLKVGGPMLVVALLVGVAISLLQALTQIQEQTLVFVPKILALAAAALFAMPFMGDAMASYMTRIAERIAGG